MLTTVILALKIFLNTADAILIFKYHVRKVCIHFSVNMDVFPLTVLLKEGVDFSFFFIAVNQIYYLCLLQTHFAIKVFKILSPSSGGITKGETNKEDDFI